MESPLEDVPPPEQWVVVEDTPYGALRFYEALSPEGENLVGRLLVQDIPARAFAAQVLHSLLAEPTLTLDAVGQWEESLLLRAARTWVNDGLRCPKHPSEQITSLDAFREAIKAHWEEVIERLLPGHKAILDAITPALKMMPSANQMRDVMASAEALRSLPLDLVAQQAPLLRSLQPVWAAQQAQIIVSWLNAVMPLSTLQQMIDAWAYSQAFIDIADSSFVRFAHDISALIAGFLPLTFPPAAFPNLMIGFFQAATEDDQRAFLRNKGFTPEQVEAIIFLRERYHSSDYQP